jgi:hypothetical protein
MIPKLERFPGMIPPKPFYARIWMCAYIYIYMWYYVIIYAIKIILHGYSIGQWTRETFPLSVVRWPQPFTDRQVAGGSAYNHAPDSSLATRRWPAKLSPPDPPGKKWGDTHNIPQQF